MQARPAPAQGERKAGYALMQAARTKTPRSMAGLRGAASGKDQAFFLRTASYTNSRTTAAAIAITQTSTVLVMPSMPET